MEEEKTQLNNEENNSSIEENNSQKTLKTLRTYQGDVEEIIGKNKTSIASIAVAEQKRKIEKPQINPDEELERLNKKRKMIFIFSFILLFLSIGVVGYIYYTKSKTDPINVALKNTIIGYSEKVDIKLEDKTKKEIADDINKRKTEFNKQINSVLFINITKEDNSAENINNILERIVPNISQSFLRSLDKDYMFGIYSFDTNEPFIILTTKDFGSSFSGMLKWESTILNDLKDIFPLAENKESVNYIFKDESVKNIDLRVVSDENKKIIFAYAFIDKNTIVISRNENIITSILSKFISNKTIR